MARALVAIVLAALIVAIAILAALAYIESHKLIEESSKPMKIEEKVSLWFKSAYYMLLFSILALIVAILAYIAITITLKRSKL
jgi:hypothetical protein